MSDAVEIATRVLKGLAATPMEEPSALTLSAGVAERRADVDTKELLLRAVDQALLRAKREGRNRVVAAT